MDIFDKFKHLNKKEAQELLKQKLAQAKSLAQLGTDNEYIQSLLEEINLLDLYIKTYRN